MKAKRKKAVFDPKAFLGKVGNGRTIAKYGPGRVVFRQGDAAEAVFYIQKGRVKITVISKTGKEAVLAILGPGDFFGEECLVGHSRRLTTVTPLTECSIMRLAKADMLRALSAQPRFSELFVAFLLQRNMRLEEDLVDQLFNSSEKRLARILLLLANFGKGSRPEPIHPRISQETLAEMVGTTRSRVSSFMNKFRRLGFIDYNGGLQVNSSLLNVILRD